MSRLSAMPAWQWQYTLLCAFTVLFGLHLFRHLVPLLVFLLGDRFGWSPPLLGLVGFAIVATAFLAAPLNRLLGTGTAFALAVFLLGAARIAVQLWTGDPLGDLVIAAIGTAAFVIALPLFVGMARLEGETGTAVLGFGLLAGIALDVALNGWYLTYDISWQQGWTSVLLVALLVIVQMALLGAVIVRQSDFATSDTSTLRAALLWAAVGPYLYLQLLLFANIAYLTATTGWRLPEAYLALLLAHVAGVAVTALWRASWQPPLALLVVAGLVLLFLVAAPVGERSVPWLTAVAVLLGQVALAILLLFILRALGAADGRPGLDHLTTAHGNGFMLLIIFIFLYYAAYDVKLPFPNTWLPAIALLLVGAAAFFVWRSGTEARPAAVVSVAPFVVAAVALLLVLPLLKLVSWNDPAPVRGEGGPVRVMTYNLHNGFDARGYLGLEALANVIEQQKPDVIGLQEVSRGWIINGAVDKLTWLSQRLGMPFVYGPTGDAQWGNAILSRYPIVSRQALKLPPAGLPLQRGMLLAQIDVGNGEALNVINTHYHHRPAASEARVQHSNALLQQWRKAPRTVVIGDLNARPDTPEIMLLRTAGFIDVLDSAGILPGYTAPTPAPRQRLDYIWITPDLHATNAIIPTLSASDHLAVAATVE